MHFELHSKKHMRPSSNAVTSQLASSPLQLEYNGTKKLLVIVRDVAHTLPFPRNWVQNEIHYVLITTVILFWNEIEFAFSVHRFYSNSRNCTAIIHSSVLVCFDTPSSPSSDSSEVHKLNGDNPLLRIGL
jgi:hypothetical protein